MMTHRITRRRRLCLLLGILLVSFAFLSMLLAATHAMHSCRESQCMTCAVIHSAQSLLRHLFLVALLALAALAAHLKTSGLSGRRAHPQKAQALVSLKTRLNP